MQSNVEILIDRAAAEAGVEPARARAAAAGALGLLEKHASEATLAPLYAAVPGALELARSDAARPKAGGGLFGGLMKSAGGLSGAAMADAMGLLGRLEKQGLDRDTLKRLVTALRAQVEAATGRDILGDAVKSVPGVGGLIG